MHRTIGPMIKSRKVCIGKEEIMSIARRVLSRRGDVVFAYLFGGLAGENPSPLSDIDLAIYIEKTSDSVQVKTALLSDLIDALRTDEVDLVILNTAPLPLSGRVLQQNILLVDRDPFRRHAYESLVLREFFDLAMKERIFLEGRFASGR